jgi:hypothetical protein
MAAGKDAVLEKLREITSHKCIKLTNSCNSSILLSLIIAKAQGKSRILIPDQGGWLTFRTFPLILGLKIVEINTNHGIIDLKDLEKNADSHSALIITSLAGYITPQPLDEIAHICKSAGCLLIEDASGSIGYKGLCDGNYSDIIVASFGRWKPINLGYGGFISTNNKEFFQIDSELFMALRFPEEFYPGLLRKIEGLGRRITYLRDICQKVKSDLHGMEIIHKDQPGLNVIVKFKNDAQKEKIINYCKENSYQFTLCPRYIRVMDNAISMEIKRLEEVPKC